MHHIEIIISHANNQKLIEISIFYFEDVNKHHILFPSVGDKPKLISGVTDVTVIAPEVATLECCVKLGMDNAEIRWFKNAKEVYAGRKYVHFFNCLQSLQDISNIHILITDYFS